MNAHPMTLLPPDRRSFHHSAAAAAKFAITPQEVPLADIRALRREYEAIVPC